MELFWGTCPTSVFPLENGFGVLLYGALCVCAYLCVLGYIGVHAYGDVCTCVPTRVCMSLRCPLVTVRPQGSGPPEWEGSGVSCPSVPLPFLCLGFRVTRCSQGHVRWSCVRGPSHTQICDSCSFCQVLAFQTPAPAHQKPPPVQLQFIR